MGKEKREAKKPAGRSQGERKETKFIRQKKSIVFALLIVLFSPLFSLSQKVLLNQKDPFTGEHKILTDNAKLACQNGLTIQASFQLLQKKTDTTLLIGFVLPDDNGVVINPANEPERKVEFLLSDGTIITGAWTGDAKAEIAFKKLRSSSFTLDLQSILALKSQTVTDIKITGVSIAGLFKLKPKSQEAIKEYVTFLMKKL